MNPALAGSQKCGRLSLNYRDQWSRIPGNFTNFSASYDQHFNELSGALGIIVSSMKESASYVTTGAGIIYSYDIQVNDVFSVKAAVQASIVSRRVNWEHLIFQSQIDPQKGFDPGRLGEDVPNSFVKPYPDFSTGFVGYSENFYAGIAVHHLNRPDEGFNVNSRLPMKFTAHAGAVIDLEPKQRRFRNPHAPTISPNIIYQQQGTAQQINYGVYFNNLVQSLVLGLWYRQTIAFNEPESIAFLVGIRHNALSIGYSYDLSISGLRLVSGGSHELSMSYLLPCRNPRIRIKQINCPSF
jgi:type IX secretion system PorP/SprF family membrane protein